jgi:hypothetical protein
VRAGQAYVDVGTLHGYREAIRLLSATPQEQDLWHKASRTQSTPYGSSSGA